MEKTASPINAIKKAIFTFLIASSLVACNSIDTTVITPLADKVTTATVTIETEINQTQETIPTITPLPYLPSVTPSVISGNDFIITPQADQRIYIDPEGWYSVAFPADMKPDKEENSFVMAGRRLETGYLPEMGTMSYARNVCAWIANVIEEKPEDFVINWIPTGSVKCSVSTKPDLLPQVKYEVFENPEADPEHRFIFVKKMWFSASNSFETNFTWLKPLDETTHTAKLLPITPEEKMEWEAIAPFLQNVLITEYALLPDSNPYHEMLMDAIPEDARPAWARKQYSGPEVGRSLKDSITLQTLGYEEESEIIEISSGPYLRKRLYRDGRLLFDYVFDISDIYSFPTSDGLLTAFVVTTRRLDGEQNAFLIQDDAIIVWSYSHQDPPFAPILYQDKPLWIKASEDWSHVQVIKSSAEAVEILYTFAIHAEPMYSTYAFTNWKGHWVWAPLDFLIIDGEVINTKLGFQEIFNWRLIGDKPAYLFRKDGRVGFSYDGKILPLEYQNVARYMCCGYAVNNPFISDDSAHFFAERDGVWYYVVLKFR